ncbi:unnamed protein product [Arabis nemorensis]|uniref:Pectinesterase inhibitor domain-containing protein n=1 Tax=Arabis nemorensis TaxID=586526 RepID=A0A565CBL7_9BRAS|nr:unnamed protein product [Arabis nemorensis]
MASSSSSYGFILVSMALCVSFSFSLCLHTIHRRHLPTTTSYRQSLLRPNFEIFPLAASATTTFKAAQAVLRLDISYAAKSAAASAKAASESPNMKKQFERCQGEFTTIIGNLKRAGFELKEDPITANYSIKICIDSTNTVRNLVGKYSDKDSKNVIIMTSMMEKFLDIAEGATVALGG